MRVYPATTKLAAVDEPVCIVFGTREENLAIARLMRRQFLPSPGGLGAGRKPCQGRGHRIETGACLGRQDVDGRVLRGLFVSGKRTGDRLLPGRDAHSRPQQVDLAGLDRTEKPAVPIRGLFFHHTWKSPHANSWRLWDFEGWKEAIDWMRRKRFNVVPMMCDTGGYMWGDVIFKTFDIPRNDKTLAQFVVDPSWRRELNKKVFAYARGSGVRIAYNLFYSQVPEFFADYYPQLKYHPLNMRNVGINADQPKCRQIMRRYWKAILDTYGLDDSHIYLVCPYRHEHVMGEGFAGKNSMTNAAWEILQELDPEATMYVESWCWKYRDEKVKTPHTLDTNPGINWREFNEGVPREVGVVEWDVPRSHPMPKEFDGRPYIQLTHTNMEGWWPPNTHGNHPQWLIDFFGNAIDHGAHGVLFFHIQANTNEILADLSSQIGLGVPTRICSSSTGTTRGGGLVPHRSEAFRGASLCYATASITDRTGTARRCHLSLVPPAAVDSAEYCLAKCEETGEAARNGSRLA